MMGRPDPTLRRLGLAMLVVQAVSFAGPSHAAAVNSPGSDLVNGMPCNDPCKAYMAWSDRMLARFALPRPPAHAQPRTAAHPKKPERTAHHATEPRLPGLPSLAQLPQQNGEAPQQNEPRQIEMASSQPASSITDQLLEATAGLAEPRTEASSAAPALADPMPMSIADPISATQRPIAAYRVAARPAVRLQISLVLAFFALLAFGSWGWIRMRTEATSAIQ